MKCNFIYLFDTSETCIFLFFGLFVSFIILKTFSLCFYWGIHMVHPLVPLSLRYLEVRVYFWTLLGNRWRILIWMNMWPALERSCPGAGAQSGFDNVSHFLVVQSSGIFSQIVPEINEAATTREQLDFVVVVYHKSSLIRGWGILAALRQNSLRLVLALKKKNLLKIQISLQRIWQHSVCTVEEEEEEEGAFTQCCERKYTVGF